MADILHEVTIDASPAKVYQALTEQSGLQGWWTEHTKAKAQTGTVSEFSFYGGMAVFKLSVDKLDPGSKVYWGVEQGPPGWENTRITWDLSGDDGKTKLLFGHRGWASTEGMYASVSYNWAWYMTSLKQYIETGKGTPHTDADMG
jgi:uncharacterized protein YndB with AHSA1/START domain